MREEAPRASPHRGGGRLTTCLYYLVTSHEAQVAEGLAALRDLSGPLVRDVLTPAGVHRLDGAAVLADSYQGCGTQGNKGRGVKSLATPRRAAAAAGDVTGCDISFRCLGNWHGRGRTRRRAHAAFAR